MRQIRRAASFTRSSISQCLGATHPHLARAHRFPTGGADKSAIAGATLSHDAASLLFLISAPLFWALANNPQTNPRRHLQKNSVCPGPACPSDIKRIAFPV